jgi:hypothetical protein
MVNAVQVGLSPQRANAPRQLLAAVQVPVRVHGGGGEKQADRLDGWMRTWIPGP